jgi:hypothetical protein
MLISFESTPYGTYQAPTSLVDEVLERFWFRSVDEVRSVVESWAGHSFTEIYSKVALCIIFADFTAAERANTADRVLGQVEPAAAESECANCGDATGTVYTVVRVGPDLIGVCSPECESAISEPGWTGGPHKTVAEAVAEPREQLVRRAAQQ